MDKAKLNEASLQIFFNLSKEWELSEEQEISILGFNTKDVFYTWKASHNPNDLNDEVLLRISYLMSIYKALQQLITDSESTHEWIRKPNNAPLFSGQSAISIMTSGEISDLVSVHHYLSAQLQH